MESELEPAFVFVHAPGSSGHRGRDDGTSRRIRQHVMREIGKQRRKPVRNPKFDLAPEFSVEVTRPSFAPGSLGKFRAQPISQSLDRQQPLPLARPFGDQHPFAVMYNSWGMDPFAVYAFGFALKGQSSPSHGSFWFPFAFGAPEFYRRMLTGPELRAALHSQPKEKSTAITLTRFSTALDCIKDRIESPDISVSATNQFTTLDYVQAAMHFEGLQRMIAIRGGVASLSNDHDLRLMIFWLDVTCVLVYGTKPVFAIPSDLIPPLLPSKHQEALGDMISGWKASYPGLDTENSSILRSLGDLSAVSAIVESELTFRGDSLWEDDIFLGLRVNPIAHCLFNTPPAPLADIECGDILEVARLGTILFIIWVKQRSHSYPGSHTASYWSALLSLMKRAIPDGPCLMAPGLISLTIWALVLCVVTTSNTSDQDAAMESIAQIAFAHTLKSWEAVMEKVRLMPWTSGLELSCSKLGVKFEESIRVFARGDN